MSGIQLTEHCKKISSEMLSQILSSDSRYFL